MAKSAEVAVDVTGKFTMVSATAAAGLKEWKQRELSRVEWVGWLVVMACQSLRQRDFIEVYCGSGSIFDTIQPAAAAASLGGGTL